MSGHVSLINVADELIKPGSNLIEAEPIRLFDEPKFDEMRSPSRY